MKRLLIILLGVMLLVACNSNKEESVADDSTTESTEPVEEIIDEQEQNEEEGIHRVTNIDLDEFIESYNSLANDAGIGTFERNGNESITADGLLISMNDDGTVWGIVQPTQATPLSVISTLLAIKNQTSDEDAEKIDALLKDFAMAMDDKEELFIETINIESMEISISTINGEVFLFHVLGDEQS